MGWEPPSGGSGSGTITKIEEDATDTITVTNGTGPTVDLGVTPGTYVPIELTTAGAPTTGTWPAGQSIVDKNGIIWNTVAGGSPGTWVQTSAVGAPLPTGTPTLGEAVIVSQVSPLVLGYETLLQFTTAGQIPVGTGASTGELLAIGTAGQALTVGGADPSGLEWATPTVVAAAPPNDGPTGCLAQTISRRTIIGGTTLANSSVAYGVLIPLYAGQVIGHLGWNTVATAAVTPTHQWMALLDLSGHLLATTSDGTTTAIPANTQFQYPIAQIASGASSTYTVPTTGEYYIALMIVAGTMPTGGGVNTALNTTAVELSPPLFVTFGSGLAGPPSFPTTETLAATNLGSPYFAAYT
jgi:hypothetical protein